MDNQPAEQKAQILYDINSATFKNGPAFREITLVVNVRDHDDCARALSLLGEKLAIHLSKSAGNE